MCIRIWPLLVLTLLGACASGTDYRDYREEIEPVSSDEGRIYVYRTDTFGLANQPAVRLNDRQIGRAVPEGFFYVDVAPGSYTISCATEVTRSVDVEIDAGATYYVRLDAKLGIIGNRLVPELVSTRKGAKEILSTRYTGD